MTKSILSIFTILILVSGVAAYQQYQEDQTQVLYKSQSQNKARTALAERMENEICSIHENGSVVMMSEHDERAYLVLPSQTLGQAIASGSLAQEKGNCVREDPDNPPDEGEVSCECYKHTNCGGQESRTCKRHCKRSLCKCCPGV